MIEGLEVNVDAVSAVVAVADHMLTVECVIAAGPTVLIGVVGVWVFRRVVDRQLRSGELSLY